MTFEPVEHEPDDYEPDDTPAKPPAGRTDRLWRRFWRTLTGRRDVAERWRPTTGDNGQPPNERDGDAMTLADVPDGLVRAALKAYCVHCSLTVGRQPLSDHEEEARTILAAALPLHAKQLRAERQQLRPEYGIRAEWINGLSSEGSVADTLDSALRALEQFDARHGDRIVSRELVVRPVGKWRRLDAEQQPEDGDRGQH